MSALPTITRAQVVAALPRHKSEEAHRGGAQQIARISQVLEVRVLSCTAVLSSATALPRSPAMSLKLPMLLCPLGARTPSSHSRGRQED